MLPPSYGEGMKTIIIGKCTQTVPLCGETLRTIKSMKTIIILYSAITLCLCPLAMAETKVSDLDPAKVIGRLSKPIGTRMVIEGVFAKPVNVDHPLNVLAVDGQALKQPVRIDIRGKLTIQRGTSYRLEGYESGGFDGSPEWLQHDQESFGFHSFFVVTKVLEPKSK